MLVRAPADALVWRRAATYPPVLGLLAVLLLAVVLPGGGPALAGARIEGIDVSKYQHPGGAAIDWPAVAASGRRFVLIQATKGPAPSNDYFPTDWAGAGAAGLIRGAYHYAQPRLPLSTAATDAQTYLQRVGLLAERGVLPPLLDLEVSNGLAPDQLRQWAQVWLDSAEQATGRRPMVYTYRYFWQRAMADTRAFAGYPLWMASYASGDGPTRPLIGGWTGWTMWQYSSTGRVPGIVGNVDLNRFCCDEAELDRLANGSAARPPRGALDEVSGQPGSVRVRGWVLEPGGTAPLQVHTYVDGAFAAALPAAVRRPDVGAAFPEAGDLHGYDTLLRLEPGRHTVCSYAISPRGGGNPRLGCATVTAVGSPARGSLDGITDGRVRGWAADPTTAEPDYAVVTVDGGYAATLTVSEPRPDVAAAVPTYGPNQGYDAAVALPPEPGHVVCVATAKSAASPLTPLGCATT